MNQYIKPGTIVSYCDFEGVLLDSPRIGVVEYCECDTISFSKPFWTYWICGYPWIVDVKRIICE